MISQWLTQFAGTKWSGVGELWLDPEGNTAEKYGCVSNIGNDAIHYSWIYGSDRKTGSYKFNNSGAIWVDSWHQNKPANCLNVPEALGIFTVYHTYEVPDNPGWGWESKLSERPDGTLVLQMTNITPWGEEGRAVRMVFTREKA